MRRLTRSASGGVTVTEPAPTSVTAIAVSHAASSHGPGNGRTYTRTVRTIRVGGVIRRPVEDVFRVLSNPENAPKWSLNALEEKLTSPPPVGVGSTRRAVVKSFGGRTAENQAVCTEFEPNRRIAWQSTSAPFPFHVTVDFMPLDGGTRIDSTWTLQWTGLMRPLGSLLDGYFTSVMRRDVENLARLMEAGEL